MYNEIEKHGNITKALNFEFSKIDSPFRVSENESMKDFPLVYARVENGNKFSLIYIAAKKKLYLFSFWRNGVSLANGETSEIKELVKIIEFWLSKEVSIKELTQNFKDISGNKKAAAFDENREVEYAWYSYLQDDNFKFLHDFIKIASQDNVVGKLFPFTSLGRLCLSRCTGYPYTFDTPIVISIQNESEKYEVRDAKNLTIGIGTATEALKMLKDNLPKDIKPAIKGTADDL